MSVFRVEKTNDFTVMSNYHLRDRSISLKAKGLLSLMLALPEDWDFTMAGLARINKDGLACIKSTIDELVEAGYIIHSRVRNAKGQLKGAEYTIYEHPVGKDERMRSVTPIFKNELLVTDDIDQPFTFDGLPIHGDPIQEKPILDSPTQEEPTQDEPTQENPAQLNTYLPITNKQNTYSAITHSFIPQEERLKDLDADEIETQRQRIREQIDYDYICTVTNRGRIDELVENILEVMFTLDKEIRVGKTTLPTHYVQGRFRKITGDNILHVLDGLDENTSFVRYPKGYILACLFNSTGTMDNDITMRVQRDIYGR